jgi:hypothetical protein
MGGGERPLTRLEPESCSLADGTNALQPGRAPRIEIDVPGDAGLREKSAVEKKLVKRIRALSEEVRSKSDYTKLKKKIYDQGGKWVAPNGVTYGVTKEGWVYEYLSDHDEGLAQTTIVALDAVPPFIAVIHTDLQFVDPEKRDAILKELEVMAKRHREPPVKPAKPETATSQPESSEIITIVEKDWLSKITLARWGTIEWRRHLKPTQMTLAARAKKGEKFDEDLIYPGDTFEVISSGVTESGSP